MVSKNQYFTINLTDHEVLESLGVVYGASGKYPESEYPRRNSDMRISSQLSAEERKTLVSGPPVIDDTPQSQEAVTALANECRGLINASLNQKSVASLLHISAEILSLMTTQRPPALQSFRLKNSQPLYPAWQFSASETIPYLRKILSQAPADAHVLMHVAFHAGEKYGFGNFRQRATDFPQRLAGRGLRPGAGYGDALCSLLSAL